MGDTRITNGAGGPMAAALVDKDNNLHVAAHTMKIATYRALHGEAFASLVEIDLVDGTTKDLMFFRNDSTTLSVLAERIWIQGTLTMDTCEVWAGVTYTSGGADVTPINVNFSSANVLDATIKHGTTALTLGYTTAKELYSIKPNAREATNIELDGRWIFGKNNTLGLKVSSPTATAGTPCKVRCTMVVYTLPVDYQT